MFGRSVFASHGCRLQRLESLASGYRITTNHHGIDVIVGETVTAWADTTDLTTSEVTFMWKWNDNETPKRTKTSPSTSPGIQVHACG